MIHGTHASAKRCKCDVCAGFRREYMRDYREKNKETLREKERARAGVRNARSRQRWAEDPAYRAMKYSSRLKTYYGITLEEYQALLEKQGGRCAIEACGATEPNGMGSWHVDHDHSCCPGPKSCGECVRGLLCGTCNTGIGMLRDSPSLLESAADYIRRSTIRKLD